MSVGVKCKKKANNVQPFNRFSSDCHQQKTFSLDNKPGVAWAVLVVDLPQERESVNIGASLFKTIQLITYFISDLMNMVTEIV